MENFLQLIQANGIEGLITGAAVLLLVYALSAGNVAVSGNAKRLANVVLSILLSGLSLLDPGQNEAVEAALASVLSALAYEFIQYLIKQRASKSKG